MFAPEVFAHSFREILVHRIVFSFIPSFVHSNKSFQRFTFQVIKATLWPLNLCITTHLWGKTIHVLMGTHLQDTVALIHLSKCLTCSTHIISINSVGLLTTCSFKQVSGLALPDRLSSSRVVSYLSTVYAHVLLLYLDSYSMFAWEMFCSGLFQSGFENMTSDIFYKQ